MDEDLISGSGGRKGGRRGAKMVEGCGEMQEFEEKEGEEL